MMGVTDTPDSPEALLRMLLGHPGESFEDRLRQELAKQTFVGGKRVVKQKLPKLPKHAETTVHVVKVTLHGAKPPVWRRLEIPSAMTLDLMHGVMLAAFGWHGYHLHVGHGDRDIGGGGGEIRCVRDKERRTGDRGSGYAGSVRRSVL